MQGAGGVAAEGSTALELVVRGQDILRDAGPQHQDVGFPPVVSTHGAMSVEASVDERMTRPWRARDDHRGGHAHDSCACAEKVNCGLACGCRCDLRIKRQIEEIAKKSSAVESG